MNLLICFGTRPEYIKVKSLIDNIPNVKTCFTGQHKDLINNIPTTYQLIIEDKTNNRLNNIISSILQQNNIFNDITHVLVQGDTTSALAIAISVFNNNKKVIHLEAGLRSHIAYDPYPEEMNRRLISQIADIHLCPTELNRENLIKEGITKNIYITGNTGLDNLDNKDCKYNNVVLITMHRRDNLPILDIWFQTLNQIAESYPDIQFIIPLHPNPEIQKLSHLLTNIRILPSLEYAETVKLMKESRFIITDSGGIQEEASFLNKKVIICRKSTERPEILGTFGTLCSNPKDLPDIVNFVYNNYEINEKCPYIVDNTKAYVHIIKILEGII